MYDDSFGEWDGDEYNGWRFVEYEVPGEQVQVWVARSQPRDQVTGSIAFDISYNIGTNNVTKLRVPIQALMDLEDNTFPYEEVTEAVNDWIATAKKYPKTRRNCLCCWQRATKGRVLCGECNIKFGELIYADVDEDSSQLWQARRLWYTGTTKAK